MGNPPPGAESSVAGLVAPGDLVATSSDWGVSKPDPAYFARLISDRAYIIERGRICFGGTMAELDARPDIRDAHLSL